MIITYAHVKYSTQTKTITAVVSAVGTITVTTSTTATVATTTVLFTESTTTTASTSTNTALLTTTVLATSTDVQTAPAITTTTTAYGASLPGRRMARQHEVVARGNNPWGIPDYAWPACQDWSHYADACKCFGIHPVTVTKQPTTTTVTVTATNARTTTVSTLTTTKTNTIPATATTSATFTAVIEVIASTATTQTVTEASTVVVSTTTTPTVTSTQLCRPTGVPFRAVANVFGDPSFLLDAGGFAAWSDVGGFGNDAYDVGLTTFELDSNGQVERVPPEDAVLYISLADGSSPTQQILIADRATVEGGAPDFVPVRGCINPTSGVVSLVADGRSNILSCDSFAYLSSGDGTDQGLDCAILMVLATGI